MATNYHHGVTVTETTDLSTMITDIDSAVIGVVCTADDADETAFPLDTPVLITAWLTCWARQVKPAPCLPP